VITSHEALLFNERIEHFTRDNAASAPTSEDVVESVFAEMRDIYPLGYPTEQFLTKIKNDVTDAFVKLREQRQKALDDMKR
jgi:hypothetical protein